MPLSWLNVRSEDRPRILTVAPSPPSRWITTPGTRCNESATFLSGNLPMSSAVITSTTLSDARLFSKFSLILDKMPRTSMTSIFSFSAAFFLAAAVAGVLSCFVCAACSAATVFRLAITASDSTDNFNPCCHIVLSILLTMVFSTVRCENAPVCSGLSLYFLLFFMVLV